MTLQPFPIGKIMTYCSKEAQDEFHRLQTQFTHNGQTWKSRSGRHQLIYHLRSPPFREHFTTHNLNFGIKPSKSWQRMRIPKLDVECYGTPTPTIM